MPSSYRMGPGVFPALVEPIDADFAWVNQGGASVDVSAGGIYLLAPAGGSSNNRIRKKAAPSTPWTLTIGFIPFTFDANYVTCGLALRESSTSKLIFFLLGYVDNPVLRVERYTNETTFSADALTKTITNLLAINPAHIVYLRVLDNGTNLIYSYSIDGVHFRQFLSESRTAFMAGGPNEIGFFANGFNASYDSGIWLIHWSVN